MRAAPRKVLPRDGGLVERSRCDRTEIHNKSGSAIREDIVARLARHGEDTLQLLLDTRALLWWLAGDDQLSLLAKTAIADEGNPVFISATSVWEIATKHRLGKLPGASMLVADLEGVIAGQGFASLPISVRHAQAAGALPGPHRDPFDRMLIAQAMLDDLALVSNEREFEAYGVKRLW